MSPLISTFYLHAPKKLSSIFPFAYFFITPGSMMLPFPYSIIFYKLFAFFLFLPFNIHFFFLKQESSILYLPHEWTDKQITYILFNVHFHVWNPLSYSQIKSKFIFRVTNLPGFFCLFLFCSCFVFTWKWLSFSIESSTSWKTPQPWGNQDSWSP